MRIRVARRGHCDRQPLQLSHTPYALLQRFPANGPQSFSALLLLTFVLPLKALLCQFFPVLLSLFGKSLFTLIFKLQIIEGDKPFRRSEEHTSELQSRGHLVC